MCRYNKYLITSSKKSNFFHCTFFTACANISESNGKYSQNLGALNTVAFYSQVLKLKIR